VQHAAAITRITSTMSGGTKEPKYKLSTHPYMGTRHGDIKPKKAQRKGP